ncbi:manganese efflux pump MntP [Butyricicoccus sp.]|uniref:manganese efflux pump MntP n=1 Tax=Butyricicoccus sp. TaxID=2049021 RepID=UPI002A8BF7CA|nr:manganese efflux pump MntP family protein [Butyricicoccus sp.]
MNVLDLFILAVGLSMDAFAVSICKGLSVRQLRLRHACLAGLYFGGFQLLMPLIGYLLGSQFQRYIVSIDHWIAFVLLVLIGANMVKESRGDAEELNDSFSAATMLPLAVATSIDALAVGVTFAFLEVSILPAVTFIGCTTFILSAIGIKIGHAFGVRYKSRAELVGGIVLILMGCKILLEHLGFLG